MCTQQTFMGIDISKTQLDVASRPFGSVAHFANTEDGIAACVAWTRSQTPELLVVEATGSWERGLVAALMLAQVTVAGSIHARGMTSPKPPANWPKPTG